jgi:DNA-binding protein YbaB
MDESRERPSAGLTNPLERAIALLGQSGTQAPGQPPEVRGVGYGGDQRVRAEVSAFGRLEELSIDPHLTRLGTTAIAEYVVEAVRAAQDDAARRSAEALQEATPALDPDALAAQLGQVSLEASRGLDRMLSTLAEMTARIDGRRSS